MQGREVIVGMARTSPLVVRVSGRCNNFLMLDEGPRSIHNNFLSLLLLIATIFAPRLALRLLFELVWGCTCSGLSGRETALAGFNDAPFAQLVVVCLETMPIELGARPPALLFLVISCGFSRLGWLFLLRVVRLCCRILSFLVIVVFHLSRS